MLGKRSKAEIFIDVLSEELPEVFRKGNYITVNQYARINRNIIPLNFKLTLKTKQEKQP